MLIPGKLIWPRSNSWDNSRAKAIKQDFDVARDDIFLLKSTYRQHFSKHTRHLKFMGLCASGQIGDHRPDFWLRYQALPRRLEWCLAGRRLSPVHGWYDGWSAACHAACMGSRMSTTTSHLIGIAYLFKYTQLRSILLLEMVSLRRLYLLLTEAPFLQIP